MIARHFIFRDFGANLPMNEFEDDLPTGMDCPNCGQHLAITEGQPPHPHRVRCPHCGTQIQYRDDPAAAAEPPT